ncbi:MAG: hypothetical protein R3E82_11560 [Pseudomonadales bacterium]
MSKKETKKRAAPLSYRPPLELRAEFDARVKNSGLSINAFITKAIFDQQPGRAARRPPLEQQDLARLLAQAAKIRDELEEIRLAGGDNPNNTLLIERACDDLAELRTGLLQAMGRKP